VIANAYLVTLLWNRYLGVQPRNVLGFLSTGNAAHVATVLEALWTTTMFDSMEAGHAFLNFGVLALDGSSAAYPGVGGSQGGQSSNHIQPAQSVVLSLITGLRGPAKRGRVYIGPVSTNSNLDGVLNTTQAGHITSGWTAFFASAEAATPPVQPAIISRKHGYATPVTGLRVDPTLGAQRRRLTQLR
jgi:hypothetical protein